MGDGGGGEAEDTEGLSKVIEAGIGEGGFEQATGEDANEGDLFDEAGGIGGFDAIEVVFLETAGVEAVLEGVGVAAGCAAGRGEVVGIGVCGER